MLSISIKQQTPNLTTQPSTAEATIQRVSQAAAPMAAWVKAQIQYSLVLQTIQPLTDELSKLNSNLDVGNKRKAQCMEDIRQSDETVTRLKEEHEKLTEEAAGDQPEGLPAHGRLQIRPWCVCRTMRRSHV